MHLGLLLIAEKWYGILHYEPYHLQKWYSYCHVCRIGSAASGPKRWSHLFVQVAWIQ